MKYFFIWLLIIIAIIGRILFGGGLETSDDIVSKVNDNEELLNEIVESGTAKGQPSRELKRLGVDHVYFDDDGEYCMFERHRSFSHYSGFYYSGDDSPRGWENSDMELTEQDEGYGWESSSGDTYYTERIKENWFMYFTYF